jgi:hypothetical protein
MVDSDVSIAVDLIIDGFFWAPPRSFPFFGVFDLLVEFFRWHWLCRGFFFLIFQQILPRQHIVSTHRMTRACVQEKWSLSCTLANPISWPLQTQHGRTCSCVYACYPVWLLCTSPLVGVCYTLMLLRGPCWPVRPAGSTLLPYTNRNSLSLGYCSSLAFEAQPTVALHLKTSNAIGNVDQCSS